MTRGLLLFLILFAAGMLILVFVGILWMIAIWEKLALTMRQKANAMRENMARRALSKRGVKPL